MRLSVVAIVSTAFASIAFGQNQCSTKPVGDNPSGNPISAPLNEVVPAGTPFTISWTPTTPGNVSILLLRGPSTNVLPFGCIKDNIPNSGKYVWTPPVSLEPDVTHYGIQIIVSGTGQYQYSTQFGISNPGYSSSKPTTGYPSATNPISQASDGQVEGPTAAPTAAPTTTPVIPPVVNSTVPFPTNTTTSANSSFIVIATTQIALHPSSGGFPTSVIQPTKSMTIPSSLKGPKPTQASASASFSSPGGTGTGSPIVSPSASPTNGAGKAMVGSLIAGFGALAALAL
ncbi:MAG: hypothetical protein LQ351_004393 [Letrouitia transgressa]|nr:MAG: hypothetical protein LQ351_004393 [Letrouitia transgressa]